MGRERTRVLAVAADDPVVSVLAPIGLAASVGTALIVDLGDRLAREGGRTLRDLAAEGPTRGEAAAERRGVAVLASGGIGPTEAHELLSQLAAGWPAIVVRLAGQPWPGPVVPVMVLYPGLLRPVGGEPSAWQRVRGGSVPPGPGPVLPPVGATNVRRALSRQLPLPGRWLRSWRTVWGLPWG